MSTRMFPFITKTWNPIAGGSCIMDGEIYACPYRCKYCWARRLINKFPKGNLGKKYTGPFRIHEKAIDKKFNPGDCVAVQFMSDIGAPGIPRGVIIDVFEAIKFFKDTFFLLLTKNPIFYKNWADHIPENAILGFTMETDIALLGQEYSEAPDIWTRYLDMREVQTNLPNKRFVSVEPALKFSNPQRFAADIIRLNPWAVAVGYDNYKNKLKEPTLQEMEAFIGYLEEAGVKVYRKTIREAWDG